MYTSLKVLSISLISVSDNDFDVDGMRLVGRKALMNPPSSNASIKHNYLFEEHKTYYIEKICTKYVQNVCLYGEIFYERGVSVGLSSPKTCISS